MVSGLKDNGPENGVEMSRPLSGEVLEIGSGFTATSFRQRAFCGLMDPLIMADYYTMTEPTFGPHAHAGISAVSILFEDSEEAFNNRDSLGNDVDLMPGDLYWLKAGRGAVHDEKPKTGARTHALQVFVNLPARHKHDAPATLHVKAADMPILEGDGFRARLVLGESHGIEGASSPALPMTVLDIFLKDKARFTHRVPARHAVWILAVEGDVELQVGEESVLVEQGKSVSLHNGETDADMVLYGPAGAHIAVLQAEPVKEQFVQQGPFVMSTQQEINDVIAAYEAGELGSID